MNKPSHFIVHYSGGLANEVKIIEILYDYLNKSFFIAFCKLWLRNIIIESIRWLWIHNCKKIFKSLARYLSIFSFFFCKTRKKFVDRYRLQLKDYILVFFVCWHKSYMDSLNKHDAGGINNYIIYRFQPHCMHTPAVNKLNRSRYGRRSRFNSGYTTDGAKEKKVCPLEEDKTRDRQKRASSPLHTPVGVLFSFFFFPPFFLFTESGTCKRQILRWALSAVRPRGDEIIQYAGRSST